MTRILRMPRVGGYASLPDSNADDDQIVNGTNSNSNNTTSAGAGAVSGGIPSAVAVSVGPNDGHGAARSMTELDSNRVSAEAGGTCPNISSSASRGGPASSFRSSFGGEGHNQSAAPQRQEREDEATPLNANETSPVEGRTAAAAAAAAGASRDSSAKSKTDVDPTDGLPTAEGVFVGAPVTQSSYSDAATVSGAWPSGADSNTSAAVVAAPPSYNAHVTAASSQSRGGARGGAVVVVPGGQQMGGVGAGPGGEHRTVILVNNPRFMEQWGRHPQPFTCQSCGFTGFSSTTSVRSIDIYL